MVSSVEVYIVFFFCGGKTHQKYGRLPSSLGDFTNPGFSKSHVFFQTSAAGGGFPEVLHSIPGLVMPFFSMAVLKR